jgi:hypothetical protein
MRRPKGVEEDQIIYDLDLEAFEQLTASWNELSLNRDPAYLAFTVRRHHFLHWYGDKLDFPEPRPLEGSPVILWYDEKRPWHVPGLEFRTRHWYPKGWDAYVNKGIRPVRRSTAFDKAAGTPGRGGSAGPQPAVPGTETESEMLLAARKKLKQAEEAKAIREVQARLDALELEAQEAEHAEMAMKRRRQELERKRQEVAAMEAEKAEMQAAAKKTGQQGFRNAGLSGSKWNPDAKQPKTATSREEFPPLEPKAASQDKLTPAPRGTTAPPATGESEVQRQRRLFGWVSTTEKKPIGSRQGMGRRPTEYMVATLKRKWVPHFYGHKHIVKKIKHESQCELTTQYDGVGVFCTISIEGKPFSNVLKAHEMMLVYCEDIEMQNAKVKEHEQKEKAGKADMVCHNCGETGHARVDCSTPSECWNCGEAGHGKKKCPKPPNKGPHCWNCGKVGHMEKDCKEPKSQHPRSKEDHSKARGSHIYETQEAEERKGGIWMDRYLQSQQKKDIKDRDDTLDRIQGLLSKLNEEKPLHSLLRLSKQPLSALLDAERDLQLRLFERDGHPKSEIVFVETFIKTRGDQDGVEKSEPSDKPKKTKGKGKKVSEDSKESEDIKEIKESEDVKKSNDVEETQESEDVKKSDEPEQSELPAGVKTDDFKSGSSKAEVTEE